MKVAYSYLNFNFYAGLIILGYLLIGPSVGLAQPLVNMPETGADQMALDSARRAITKRILSETDKKAIRACEREKFQFLKDCRLSGPGNAEVDRKLNEAKLRNADPNDPAIQALMEKKFSLEKGCDDRFLATARGEQCSVGEKKRQSALEKALAQDKVYQILLKKVEALNNEHL